MYQSLLSLCWQFCLLLSASVFSECFILNATTGSPVSICDRTLDLSSCSTNCHNFYSFLIMEWRATRVNVSILKNGLATRPSRTNVMHNTWHCKDLLTVIMEHFNRSSDYNSRNGFSTMKSWSFYVLLTISLHAKICRTLCGTSLKIAENAKLLLGIHMSGKNVTILPQALQVNSTAGARSP